MVPIFFHPAARTGVRPVGQGHFLPVSAGGTGLGRIAGFTLPNSRPALSVREKEEKLRPRRIADASVQTSVGVHLVDRDVFHEDPSVAIGDLPGGLVGEVHPSERHPLVDLRHDLFGFVSFRRPFRLKLQFPLRLDHPLGRMVQKLRVLDDRPVGKCGEGLHAHIDSDREGSGGKGSLRNIFTGKCHPPFSGGRPENRTGLDLAFDGTVKNQGNGSGLRQPEAVSRQVAPAGLLRKSDRGVLALPLEPGIAGILSVLHSPEERLERQIDPHGDVLECLRIDRLEGGTDFFQGRKRILLVVMRQGHPVPFPRILSVLRKVVVEPATLFQLAGQESFLFFGRIQPIPECFKHDDILL